MKGSVPGMGMVQGERGRLANMCSGIRERCGGDIGSIKTYTGVGDCGWRGIPPYFGDGFEDKALEEVGSTRKSECVGDTRGQGARTVSAQDYWEIGGTVRGGSTDAVTEGVQ